MSGGPAHAVSVCSIQAPAVGKQVNTGSDWNLRRISLKNRNPKAVPDAWERKILQAFDKRVAAGESANKMAHSEVINGEFRVVKAQAVGKGCLKCHGKNIKPAVKAELTKYYPNDKATGYSLGQIRGAFSLRKKL
jgi:hypothetical protein